MQTAVLTGPIACGIHVSKSLLNYTAGVMTDTDSGHTAIDHSIMLVGWGADAGTEYCLLQNNWGRRWGDQGFAKLQRGVNLLGEEEQCHFPQMRRPS